MSLTLEDIRKAFPLHVAVLTMPPEESVKEIRLAMQEDPKPSPDRMDNYGRTALQLALLIRNLVAARELLTRYDPRIDLADEDGWTAWHEALVTRQADLIRTVYRLHETDRLLRLLTNTFSFSAFTALPDFYLELKWEVLSWGLGPSAISRLLFPNDTYRVYKQGASLRVDFSLVAVNGGNGGGSSSGSSSRLGFGRSTGRRERSLLFLWSERGATTVVDIDHQTGRYSTVAFEGDEAQLQRTVQPDEEFLEAAARREVRQTTVLTEGLAARPLKSLITRRQKRELVGGVQCLAYEIVGIKLHTKSRTEHLSHRTFPPEITLDSVEDYFNASSAEEKAEADIALPKKLKTATKGVKATVYMAAHHPYSIKSHLLPVLALMALVNPEMSKMIGFLRLPIFPSGTRSPARKDNADNAESDDDDSRERLKRKKMGTLSTLPGMPLIIETHISMGLKMRMTVQNHLAVGVEGVEVVAADGEDDDSGQLSHHLLLDSQLFAIPAGYSMTQ